MAIKLIVGLGNAGIQYQTHRHNAGFWFVDKLAQISNTTFKPKRKFFGDTAAINIDKHAVWLLKPTTFMNHSGSSVQAMAHFFAIQPSQILIVHDELDFACGVVKLKKGGGHGGHNGLRDTINKLGSADFYRLRIGIAHPGSAAQVTHYVLSPPNETEKKRIDEGIARALNSVHQLSEGLFEAVMNQLHAGH